VVQAFPRYKQLIAELHDQVRRIAANNRQASSCAMDGIRVEVMTDLATYLTDDWASSTL
jgi:hypothetical protein